jgi:pilus assembly protein CpaB
VKKVRILALIAAVATGLLLYVFLSSLNKPVEIDKTKVVTAAADIPAETTITAEMVTLTELPTEAVVPGAATDVSPVVGKVSDVSMFLGEQILGYKLYSTGDSNNKTLAYAIEPGMRAITIPVDETSGIAYMITPGNHVDILCYLLTEEEDPESAENEKIKKSYIRMLLENIMVLAVDNVFSSAGKAAGDSPAYTTMTLQVTPEQAMELSMAQAEGEIRTILRSPVDEDKVSLPNVTLDDVLGN